MDDAPRRTVPIKLDVPKERRGDFDQIKPQFLHCANRTSEWAWRYDDYCITSKSKAEDALYDELRGKLTSPPTSSRKASDAPSTPLMQASKN